MTKKHFIALADTTRRICGALENPKDRQTVVDRLAGFCMAQNPAFNRERWISYINGECGPNGGKRNA